MTQITQNPRLAAILILLASVFIAGTTTLAKVLGSDFLGPPLHPLQITFGRFLFAFLAIGTVFAFIRPTITKPNLPRHFLRVICGWMGVTLMFAAASLIPLGDATAISFLNPIFGMFFAILFLGEIVGRYRWIAAAIALIGGLILLRPSADSLQFGALLALGAAITLGFELIIIKKLTREEPLLQILFVNNAIGLGIAGLAASFIWQDPTMLQWLALCGIGFMMIAAQSLFINGMKRADASFVAPFSYATLIFAYFYDAIFFGVKPDSISIIGAIFIILGAFILAWREGRVTKKKS